MLFQLNYNFLSSNILSTTTTLDSKTDDISVNHKPIDFKEMKHPELKGPATHVAFVIHGIGQQTEKYGFFQKHIQSLHDTTKHAINENLSAESNIDIQYIPIEWHKHIHDETDHIMDDITPTSVPSLRMINNDYLADAFFYLSQDRSQSIINHVTKTFNQAYAQFMIKNPEFNGKIAILAYSLGGIITWDILSNQPYHLNNKNNDNAIQFPRLDFKPDYLFTLGSPLSAFLTVRNQDPNIYHPDPSIIFENIFHPFDPLGYRFEPLLKNEYKNQPAVLVDSCSSSFIDRSSTLDNLYKFGRELFQQPSNPFMSFLLSKGDCQQEKSTRCRYLSDCGGNMSCGSNSAHSGGLISALKRYFLPAQQPICYYNHLQHDEIDDDDDDDDTLLPNKLSMDWTSAQSDTSSDTCVEDMDEKENDFHSVSAVKCENNPCFVYNPHTEIMSTSINDSNNAIKRRRSNSNTHSTTIKTSPLLTVQQHNNTKKRKTLSAHDHEYLDRLLNTTVTKGSHNSMKKNKIEKSDVGPLSRKRIDYVLQPERYFLGIVPKNEYLSGLTAHFSYWTHKDLMWHITRRLENSTCSNQ